MLYFRKSKKLIVFALIFSTLFFAIGLYSKDAASPLSNRPETAKQNDIFGAAPFKNPVFLPVAVPVFGTTIKNANNILKLTYVKYFKNNINGINFSSNNLEAFLFVLFLIILNIILFQIILWIINMHGDKDKSIFKKSKSINFTQEGYLWLRENHYFSLLH